MDFQEGFAPSIEDESCTKFKTGCDTEKGDHRCARAERFTLRSYLYQNAPVASHFSERSK